MNEYHFIFIKKKLFYLQLTLNHNQFYKINSLKINFCRYRTKQT